jgi:hypothetical protein
MLQRLKFRMQSKCHCVFCFKTKYYSLFFENSFSVNLKDRSCHRFLKLIQQQYVHGENEYRLHAQSAVLGVVMIDLELCFVCKNKTQRKQILFTCYSGNKTSGQSFKLLRHVFLQILSSVGNLRRSVRHPTSHPIANQGRKNSKQKLQKPNNGS